MYKEVFPLDMNIQKHLAFVKTVELGSFTKAAEALSYSQSGISRMIADLETEWQLSLLERGRAGVRLTADGQALLPYAQRLCEAYEAIQSEVDRLCGLETGRLRIAAIPAAASHWLPNILREFQRDCPGVEYELLPGDSAAVEALLTGGRADCGFLSLPASPELDTIFLEQNQLLAILPEQHPLAAHARVPLSALSGLPFLLFHTGGRPGIAALFAKQRLPLTVRLETSDPQTVLSMAEAGLGVGILPELLLGHSTYRVSAKALDAPVYQKLGLALRDRATAPAAVRKFLEYLPYRTQREGLRRLAPPLP